jgi:hypothetical protein
MVEAPDEEAAAAAVLGGLEEDEDDALTVRFRHVQQVRTGYQLGWAEPAWRASLPGLGAGDAGPRDIVRGVVPGVDARVLYLRLVLSGLTCSIRRARSGRSWSTGSGRPS